MYTEAHLEKVRHGLYQPSVYGVHVFLPFLQRCNAEVCFEQIDEIDTGDFKYVGPGHGTYEQVTFIPEAQVVPSMARPKSSRFLILPIRPTIFDQFEMPLTFFFSTRFPLNHPLNHPILLVQH